MNGPDPRTVHPMAGFPQVCFIQNTIRNPNIVVGDYTYYDDPDDSENFERNVLYHYPFIGDKLIIGRFCAIARGVRFIMNGANHKLSGISTYPFQIFGNGWEKVMPKPGDLPDKGDTIVGNDVWIGYRALILPGAIDAQVHSLSQKDQEDFIWSTRTAPSPPSRTMNLPPFTAAGLSGR